MPGTKLNREQYWRHTRRLTFLLLALWSFVTVGVVVFARPLSNLVIFSWSVSFYMAAQGAILIYVAIIGFYAWRMSKLDQQYVDEDAHGK